VSILCKPVLSISSDVQDEKQELKSHLPAEILIFKEWNTLVCSFDLNRRWQFAQLSPQHHSFLLFQTEMGPFSL
jgi:hypothetical protein